MTIKGSYFQFIGLTAAKNTRNKVLFSVLSLEGKNQRNFDKDNDSEKAKVPKAQKAQK